MKKLILALLILGLLVLPCQANVWPNKPPLGMQINWSHPLSCGLVGCWLMNEGGGGIYRDLVNSNNGVGQSAVVWKANVKGMSPSFDGTINGYINIGANRAKISGLQQPLTIATWIYQTATGTEPIYAAYTATTASRLWSMLRIDTSTVKYYTSTAAGGYQSAGTLTINTNKWYFIAVVVGGTTSTPSYKIYVNNLSESGNFGVGAVSSTPDLTVPIYIGGDAAVTTERMKGFINNVYLWNRVLSPSEISQLYQEPYCFIEQPKSWWQQIVSGAYSGWVSITTQ